MRKIFKKLAFFFVAILSLTVSSSYNVKEVMAASNTYTRITSLSEVVTGEYVIAYVNGSTAKVWNGTDTTDSYVDYTINNNKIAVEDKYKVTFTTMSGGYSIKTSSTATSNANKYIFGTSGSNKLNFGANAELNTISGGKDSGTFAITSNTSIFVYNSTSGQNRFRYYKSSTAAGSDYKSVSLFKLDNAGSTEPETPIVKPEITLDKSNVTLKVGETAEVIATINDGFNLSDISWSSNNSNATVVSRVENNKSIATITSVSVGNAIITASIEGGESKTISVVVEANESQEPSETAETTIDLAAQGYSNQQEVTNVSDANEIVNVTFNKGTNSNATKYYTTGTAVRVYGGGYFVVTSEMKISKITITFGSGDGSNGISTDCGSYSNGTWNGESNSVKFTVGGASGHRRIKTITITYIVENILPNPTVEFDEDNKNLKVNDKVKLEPKLSNVDGITYSILWSSSDENTVTIDQDGNIDCKSIGTAIITARLIVDGEEIETATIIINVRDNRFSYNLVTDISQLTIGSKIVIAAAESDYAMSTEQKTNNRGQSIIAKLNNEIILSADTEVFTLVTGNLEGTFAFKTDGGYLYAAGKEKNNYLKTSEDLTNNSSWEITLVDGVLSIVAQGDSTNNIMQYNQSNSLFSCYASTTTTMKPISLYKLTYNVEPLKTTDIDAQLNFGYKVEDNIHTRNMYAKETVTSMDSSKNYASALGLNEDVFNVTGTADAANNYPMIKSDSYIKISGNTTLNSKIIVSSNYVIKSIEFTALLPEYDVSKVSILVSGKPVEVNENKFEINAEEFVITTNQDSGFRFNNLSIAYQEKDENTYSDFSNFQIKFTANIPETLDSLFKDNISHYGFEVTIKDKTISKEIEFDHQSSFSLVLNNISAYDVKISVKAYIVCNGNRIYFNTKEYSVIDMVNKYLEDTSKLTQEQIDVLTAFKASLEN